MHTPVRILGCAPTFRGTHFFFSVFEFAGLVFSGCCLRLVSLKSRPALFGQMYRKGTVTVEVLSGRRVAKLFIEGAGD